MRQKRSGRSAGNAAVADHHRFAGRRGEDSTAPSTASRHPASIRIGKFKPVWRPPLCGFLSSCAWPAAGLRFNSLPVFAKGGAAWILLPSVPVLDADGRHNQVDGRKQYTPAVEWLDADRGRRFSSIVIDRLRRAHPDFDRPPLEQAEPTAALAEARQ